MPPVSRISLRLIAIFAVLLGSSLARADFNDGVVALMMGEYDNALQTFVPLAETSDHAYSQYFLGRMYAEGRGVEKNPDEAAKWLRKSAEKGVQDAQFRLGGMYERGEGVPKDLEYAYGWYRVAAHIGNPKAAAAMKAAAAQLNPQEMKAAEELSEEMIQKYGNVPKATSSTR